MDINWFSVTSDAYFAVPVVDGGLVELLSKFKGDLGVLEGALGADHHFISFVADDHRRFGHITDLPGGEAHACVNTKNPLQKQLQFSFDLLKMEKSSNPMLKSHCSPSAFMYSSKFSLSTSFQVAQKASTMLKVWQGYLQSDVCKQQQFQDHSPQSCCCLLLLCTLVGGVWLPIGSGDSSVAAIGCLNGSRSWIK